MNKYTKEDIERAFNWGMEFQAFESENWEENDTYGKKRYEKELKDLYSYLEREDNE